MQALTWMLISLHGFALQASSLLPTHQDTSSVPCPALQAPPFHTARVSPSLGKAASRLPLEQTASLVEPRSNRVSFALRVGRLKPQVEALLQEHFAVQHVVWNAPEGLLWPADYQLQAADAATMIESLLQPYSLRLRLYANHTAVVQQHQNGAEL